MTPRRLVMADFTLLGIWLSLAVRSGKRGQWKRSVFFGWAAGERWAMIPTHMRRFRR